MSQTSQSSGKVSDADIVRRNNIGLSLTSIGRELGVHPTTITLRLQGLGIPPADTRRTFMDDVFKSLPAAQQEWLADQLSPQHTIKDFFRKLLDREFKKTKPAATKSSQA